MTSRNLDSLGTPGKVDEATAVDRRQWDRLRDSGNNVVLRLTNGTDAAASVLDESVGGLGMLVNASAQLQRDDVIEILMLGHACKAIVRHVEPHGDGQVRVGLEWLPNNPTSL